jgi:MYXO-CTERM domain-containing protein
MRASYVQAGNAAGLHVALSAQGYGSDWEIFTPSLRGDFRLDQYGAWTENEPAHNQYGFNWAAEANAGRGGADIALGYVPGAGDPAVADARWLQIIRTNRPLAWGRDNGATLSGDAGFTWYVDNGYTVPGGMTRDIFYGMDDNVNSTGYAANGRGLIDTPSRTLADGVVWEAWAFLATWDRDGKAITIYDGVHWGFTMTAVPTPGAIALMGLGGLLAARRRAR